MDLHLHFKNTFTFGLNFVHALSKLNLVIVLYVAFLILHKKKANTFSCPSPVEIKGEERISKMHNLLRSHSHKLCECVFCFENCETRAVKWGKNVRSAKMKNSVSCARRCKKKTRVASTMVKDFRLVHVYI